jgi:uncharacterized protein YfaS (alpha-2-macroglobulin family)
MFHCYRAKAISTGVFNIPPVYGGAIYVPILRAHSGAGTVRVDKNGRMGTTTWM